MMTATPYADIRRRLAEATGPLDGATAAGWANSMTDFPTESREWHLLVKALCGSLDAALELARAKLPSGWRGCELIEFERGRAQAGLGFASLGNGATLPLAVLDALFAEAEEAADD